MLGTPQRKPDAAEITAFIRQLPHQLGLTGGRAHWPKYLYHSTDIENAVRILETGVLLSRELATSTGSIAIDSAHQEIIEQTGSFATSCARLYFRPRTPTNFRNEGFRSQSDPAINPHGITVMLVFDALEVLTRPETTFTDGNAAHGHSNRGGDATFLRSIPFDLVYHDSAFPPDLRDEIVHRRNAEVLVPGKLELEESLKFVVLRSEAELQTLQSRLHELGPEVYEGYRTLCRVNRRTANSSDYFFRRWTFVEQVSVSEGMLTLSFSHEYSTPGPFELRLIVTSESDGRVLSDRSASVNALNAVIRTELPEICSQIPFVVELQLNGRQAFRNSYEPGDSIVW